MVKLSFWHRVYAAIALHGLMNNKEFFHAVLNNATAADQPLGHRLARHAHSIALDMVNPSRRQPEIDVEKAGRLAMQEVIERQQRFARAKTKSEGEQG